MRKVEKYEMVHLALNIWWNLNIFRDSVKEGAQSNNEIITPYRGFRRGFINIASITL